MADMEKLTALGTVAQEVDGEGPPTPEQQRQEQEATEEERQAREWGAIAFTIGGALSMLAPELRQVYTEAACMRWGESVVPVAKKYGWDGPGKVPELGLLMSTAMLVVPSFFVIKARLKEPVKPGESGMMAAVKDWWRNVRAKRAAKVVGDAVQEAASHGVGT